VFGALRWDTRSILSCTLLSPLSISRSNPSPITPAVLPPTHYLQLPAPASISCGSQQPRLCNQGVYRSNTAVDEVELLTDAGTWLKVQSTRVMVSSSEQVRAAPVCAAPLIFLYSLDPLCCAFTLASALCFCTLPPHCANICTHMHTSVHFAIPNVLPSQTVSQVSLSHNVTAVLLPKHRFFAMQPADIEEANERCAHTLYLSMSPPSLKPRRALRGAASPHRLVPLSSPSCQHQDPARLLIKSLPHAPCRYPSSNAARPLSRASSATTRFLGSGYALSKSYPNRSHLTQAAIVHGLDLAVGLPSSPESRSFVRACPLQWLPVLMAVVGMPSPPQSPLLGRALSEAPTSATGPSDLIAALNSGVSSDVSSVITCSGGSYPGEVGWSLSCSDGTTLIGGAPYASSLPLAVAVGAACTLSMTDSFSDGWNGAEWSAPGFGQGFSLAAGSARSESFVVQFQPPSPPPSPPLHPGSQYAYSSSDLIAALGDSAVSRIVLKAGTYEFDNDMCSNEGGSALCINRNLTIESEVAGSVVLNAKGARRVIYVAAAGRVALVGLDITGGEAEYVSSLASIQPSSIAPLN
jgi:hypothetical protein